MLARIKNILVLGAVSLGLFTFNTASAAAQSRTFQVANESRYAIYHIYVSPASYSRWGFDRLGDRVLNPGYEFTLSVYPTFYDIKLVDQDGDACVINNIDFRGGDRWTLTDADLVTCELATAF